MNKILLTVIVVLFAVPGFATTKCILLNENASCTYIFTGNKVSVWYSDCTTNGIKLRVTGHNICTSISSTVGSVASAWGVNIDNSNSANNVHCWCSMIHPIATNWTYSEKYSSYSDCILNCSGSCSMSMKNSSVFRGALLGSIL